MAANQIIHDLNYFSDKCACGFYRLAFPSMALQTMFGGNYRFQITDTESVITDPNFYLSNGGVRLVRIARWYGEQRLKIIRDFLKPLSEKVGFSDYSAFYRAFKKEYGISPREYRNLIAESQSILI